MEAAFSQKGSFLGKHPCQGFYHQVFGFVGIPEISVDKQKQKISVPAYQLVCCLFIAIPKLFIQDFICKHVGTSPLPSFVYHSTFYSFFFFVALAFTAFTAFPTVFSFFADFPADAFFSVVLSGVQL